MLRLVAMVTFPRLNRRLTAYRVVVEYFQNIHRHCLLHFCCFGATQTCLLLVFVTIESCLLSVLSEPHFHRLSFEFSHIIFLFPFLLVYSMLNEAFSLIENSRFIELVFRCSVVQVDSVCLRKLFKTSFLPETKRMNINASEKFIRAIKFDKPKQFGKVSKLSS